MQQPDLLQDSTVPPITEGMVRKGGRNQGPSQVKARPAAPGAINRPKGSPPPDKTDAHDRKPKQSMAEKRMASARAADKAKSKAVASPSRSNRSR